MPSVPLHYVDLRAFIYATEAERRVETALQTLLPEEFEIDHTYSEGHHGDPITVLSARVETTGRLQDLLDRMAALPPAERARLHEEVDERVDENASLFVSLDKQAAYSGEVRLGDGITFRGKVEAYPAKRENVVASARSLLEEL